MKRTALAWSTLGLWLVACTAAPSIEQPLPEIAAEEPAVVDVRPLLPQPRSPTAQGCTWLDPAARGPRVREGQHFDAIARALAQWDAAPARLHWIQPAQSPAPAPDRALYVANAGGRLRWCYVDPAAHLDTRSDAAVCDGHRELGWVLIDGTAEGPPPAPTARVVAMLDHAVRIYEDPAQVERCTPAPPSVVASITAPAWRTEQGTRQLEFVEQLHPRPDLARLVRVHAEPDVVRRTELWSWNPQQTR